MTWKLRHLIFSNFSIHYYEYLRFVKMGIVVVVFQNFMDFWDDKSCFSRRYALLSEPLASLDFYMIEIPLNIFMLFVGVGVPKIIDFNAIKYWW